MGAIMILFTDVETEEWQGLKIPTFREMGYGFSRILTWAFMGSELRERTHLFCLPFLHIPGTHMC